MPKVLIVYFSHGGNTRKMAEALAKAVEGAGCEAALKKAAETQMDDLRSADGLLLGSACYFGNMAGPMKAFIDDSIRLFGKGELSGKPAGVFASTGAIGGGGEMALISMITALLIHGMVVMGSKKGGHFGPLSIGEPDDRVWQECRDFGGQFAGLVKRLSA
jgi:NAD(P)H dehydrogenase (quinone)